MNPRSPAPPLRPASSFAAVRATVALALLACAAGCASVDRTGRVPHKDVVVEDSGLNHVSFLYDPEPGDRRHPHPVRAELFGTGLLSFASGPSPLVRDSFSTDAANPNWNAIVRARISIPPARMTEVFQIFADEGLVPSRFVPLRSGATKRLQFAGNLNNSKFAGVTDNPFLVGAFEDFLDEFFPRELRAAAALRRATP